MREVCSEQSSTQKQRPSSPFDLQQALERFECGYIQNVLQLVQGQTAEAARLLGISPQLLQKKIKTLQLHDQVGDTKA